MFSYNTGMDFIYTTQKFGSKPGLFTTTQLMKALGNPQDNLKFVHVAGTNGKGSTSCFISNILSLAGYKTGLYTSPSLNKYTERISINNKDISGEDFGKYAAKVEIACKEMVQNGLDHPTEFEIVTAMAFCYYNDMGCDIVVLEVGLGGLLDATNIIKSPQVAVITKLDFDHTEYLGNTLVEIAKNKAGIIKDNCKVALYNQEKEAVSVIADKCKETNSALNIAKFDDVVITKKDIDGQSFVFENKEYDLSMVGAYQVNNAIVAIKAIEALSEIGYDISKENIKAGLKNAFWAGRAEIISKEPTVIIDGAHNLNGVEGLKKSLENLFSGKKIIFITGILKDKDYELMIKTVLPFAKQFITVTPNSPRALEAKELCGYIKTVHDNAEYKGSVKEALEYAIKNAKKDDIICVFGSLYYLGEVREFFNK